MSRIAQVFEGRDTPAFIAFTVAGDPDPALSVRIGKVLIDAGADILELGIPFTDPVADGPVIQRADERALSSGTTPDTVFEIVRELRSYSDLPIVLLTYYNIVCRRGIERFYQDMHDSGADGVVIADMPVEESAAVLGHSRRYGIDQIFLVAETTGEDRLKEILRHAGGFIYLVSLLGVTGARESVSGSVPDLVRHVRRYTDLPLAVGFGISQPEHVRALASAGADAAITGSAIVGIIEEHLDDEAVMMQDLREYVGAMCAAGNEGR